LKLGYLNCIANSWTFLSLPR